MKSVDTLIASTVCLALTACAGMPPKAADLVHVPKIEFGQPLPADDNYVLHYPAGTPLPVSTVVDGSLFEKEASSTLEVSLRHDIYVYRQFASFDGQNWKRGRDLIETRLELQIPQKDGSHAGLLHVKMEQK